MGTRTFWSRPWSKRERPRAPSICRAGDWHDFWTGERIEGGRDIDRAVDLETMPLYVRAGAILPLGPVKQYTDEQVDGLSPFRLSRRRLARFLLYEDDGISLDHRRGQWMGIQFTMARPAARADARARQRFAHDGAPAP